MISIAFKAHGEQLDKSGQLYILHPLAVMRILNSDDEELNCIAVGHDLIEDTAVTYESLAAEFGHRVANGIRALTKHEGQTYEEYKEAVKANPDAVLVKMADLRHNSDITRQPGKLNFTRLNRYFSFYKELEEL